GLLAAQNTKAIPNEKTKLNRAVSAHFKAGLIQGVYNWYCFGIMQHQKPDSTGHAASRPHAAFNQGDFS
ncbi:MAG: hypothetical protein ACU0BE_01560, partial [Paracoccus sp. (in: a-proteobacteria)]